VHTNTNKKNGEKNMEMKYRFDDTYEKVYEYDKDAAGFVFIGSYFAFGINSDMSEAEKTRIVYEDMSQR